MSETSSHYRTDHEAERQSIILCVVSALISVVGFTYCTVMVIRAGMLGWNFSELLLKFLIWQSIPYFLGVLFSVLFRNRSAFPWVHLSLSVVNTFMATAIYWFAYSCFSPGVGRLGGGHGPDPTALLGAFCLGVVPIGQLLSLIISLICGLLGTHARHAMRSRLYDHRPTSLADDCDWQ